MKLLKRLTVFALVLLLIANSLFAQKHTNERAKWFVDSRFGMFIHWGPYSAAEGVWKGEKLRHNNDYAEWIMYRNSIKPNEYLSLLEKFDWNKINPEDWVILAKRAGMKYITFTAKHHDGFAMWKSDASDYNIWNYSNPHRDILKELAEACKKHGIKLGLYYSHWIDWEHKYGWKHDIEISGISSEDYDIYWQEKVIPQIRELLSNYGEISIFWFDMWIHHSETVVTKGQLLQLKSLIRELQPNCIINSRLGLSIDEDSDIDFKTLNDNQLGNQKEDFPWQSPATVAHSWGYSSYDNQWKSTSSLLKALINNASLNGNFMLNIGPRANGEVPYETVQRLLEIGDWLSKNGEAIYNTQAFDLDKDLHDWGRITCKNSNNKTTLYLHVFNWPLSKQISLTGVSSKPQKVYLLSDTNKTALNFEYNQYVTNINLPETQPDNYVSVICVEYNEYPKTNTQLIAKNTDNGFALTPKNSNQKLSVIKATKYGTIPEHISVNKKQTLSWYVFIEEASNKDIYASYSYQGKKSKGKLQIQVENQLLDHEFKNTGKTIGEPNSNWIIDKFESVHIGQISFPKPGIYQIILHLNPHKKQELKLHSIWLK